MASSYSEPPPENSGLSRRALTYRGLLWLTPVCPSIIADDHTLVAQALSRVLEDEFDLLEIVTDGQALVDSAARLRPDLVVTDIRMPN